MTAGLGSRRKPGFVGSRWFWAPMALAGCLLAGCAASGDDLLPDPELGMLADEPGVQGRLVISHVGDLPSERNIQVQTTEFLPGAFAGSVEDNDLRGFLDGAFKWGWNQVGQAHVRAGRREGAAMYGEYELFRFVQRWEGVRLPERADVRTASLTFHVERAAADPIRIMLYRVKRDWDPGTGGVYDDNVGPPKPGEVWWNDAAFGESPWGLPGVGYAGPSPDADTPLDALADVLLHPDDSLLVFQSDGLTDYVADAARLGYPLTLLVKVADFHEDRPGSLILVFSVDHGDSRNFALRPVLRVVWASDAHTLVDRSLVLEHGRATETNRITLEGPGWLASSFGGTETSHAPRIEVRGGLGREATEWEWFTVPRETDWEWVQFRIAALHDPVPLGAAFEATITETWVTPGEPEDVRVRWLFLSPSGKAYTRQADFLGTYMWRVRFDPPEPGPWQYRWIADFTDRTQTSEVGRFDVVAEDREATQAAIRSYIDELRVVRDTLQPGEFAIWQSRFMRLERAGMRFEAPVALSGESSVMRDLLTEARVVLGGQPIPDSIPFRRSPSHVGRD